MFMLDDCERNLPYRRRSLEVKAHLFPGKGLLLKCQIFLHGESNEKVNFYNGLWKY